MADTCSVSPAALEAFRAASPAILAETLARSLARREEVAHHGAEAERLIAGGLGFTMKMLDAAMAAGESALLEDELSWAIDRLPHDGVSVDAMVSRIRILEDVVLELLPPLPGAEIASVLQWMGSRLQELASGGEG
jgi:MerR family transcriptional regulator, light-induced transcriptional regulator